jgi:hypothetical protein
MRHFLNAAIVGILIAYTILDPPQWTRQDLDGDPLLKEGSSFGLCSSEPGYTIAMDVLIVISIILALILACRTREKLPEDLTDARRVTQTLCAHFILAVVGVILAIAAVVVDSNLLLYISVVFVAILSSLFSVAFLSIPKMYYVYYQKRTGEMPEGLRRGGNVRVSGLSTPSLELATRRFQASIASQTSGHTSSADMRNVLTGSRGSRMSSRSLNTSGMESVSMRNILTGSRGSRMSSRSLQVSSNSLNQTSMDGGSDLLTAKTSERGQLPTSVAALMAAASAASQLATNPNEEASPSPSTSLAPSPPIQVSMNSGVDDMDNDSEHSATQEHYKYSSGDVL